jgi:hypothetical protein
LKVSVNNALLGAMPCHLPADNFADEMRLDGHGVTSGACAMPDAKHEDCAPELIEAVNLSSGPRDVLENRMGLGAVRVTHAT